MGRFRPTLRFFNVTEQQWRVLRTLSSVDSLEVMELAEATNLLAPSLSRIVSDLEDRELISRKSVPHDLRRSEVSITPRGRRIIDLMEPHSDSIYTEILDAFGRDKMDQLQTLLKELSHEIQKLPPVQFDDLEALPDIVSAGNPQRGRPKRAAAHP